MLGFAPLAYFPIAGASSSAPTTPAQPDSTPPNLGGVVTVSNITSTSFTAVCDAATDNVGVVGYEVSVDTGAPNFIQIGSTPSYQASGKLPSTVYTVRFRAYDAAGQRSNTITTQVTTTVALDTENPAIPGTLAITNVTVDGCTVAWQAGSDNVGIVGYEVSADTGTPSYTTNGMNLSKAIAGLPANTLHTVRVRAFDAANNKSTPLTATFTTLAAIDSTVPVWPNGTVVTASAITHNSFTLAWPAASDNVGVAGYEMDNGSGAYVSVGSVLTTNVTGKSPSTLFTTRVRAFDSAGNKSLPLTKAVTTTAAPVVSTNVVTFARNTDAPIVWELSALSATPIGLTYKANSKQDLVLYNKSGSAVTVTLKGSTATTATTKGLAGVAIDLSVGLPISVPAGQFVTLALDNAVLFCKGVVTLDASASGVVFAGVIQ